MAWDAWVDGEIDRNVDVQKGAPYTFSMFVNRDGVALNGPDPKVTVEVDSRILEQYIFEAFVLLWVGGIVAVLGMIVLSWAVLATHARKAA
jgi:hypothetical protein